jgi:ATP-dependent DNA ligase
LVFFWGSAYFFHMPSTFDFCLPTKSAIVPHGPDWLHEVKYDGYRIRLERDGNRVRLIARGGYDWTKRFPWIVEAALKNRQKRFATARRRVKTLGSVPAMKAGRGWSVVRSS